MAAVVAEAETARLTFPRAQSWLMAPWSRGVAGCHWCWSLGQQEGDSGSG